MLNAVSNWKPIGVILPAFVPKSIGVCMTSTLTYKPTQALQELNVNLLKSWPAFAEGRVKGLQSRVMGS